VGPISVFRRQFLVVQVLQVEVDDDIIEEDVGLEAGVVVGVDRDGGGTGGTVVEVFDVGQRLEKT
jgi:hypothetical protein